MPKEKDKRADEALELYKQGLKLIDIAARLHVPEGTIRSWKNRYKWNATLQIGECNVAKKEKKKKKSAAVEQIVNNGELSDREQLFCAIYVRCFNATRTYMKAFGHGNKNSAAVLGCQMLKRPEVAAEIRRLKEDRMNRAFFSEEDVFQKYMEIAFADRRKFERITALFTLYFVSSGNDFSKYVQRKHSDIRACFGLCKFRVLSLRMVRGIKAQGGDSLCQRQKIRE